VPPRRARAVPALGNPIPELKFRKVDWKSTLG
jgi:hypothetical protein